MPSEFLLCFFIALLGLLCGSFLNVVIHRLPRMLETEFTEACQSHLKQTVQAAKTYHLAWPGSHCPQCETALCWYHTIPLLSFVFLRGKCAFCHERIIWRYPIVELLSMLLTTWSVIQFGWTPVALAVTLYGYFAIVILSIDLAHHCIPDNVNYSFLWLGLLFNLQGMFTPLAMAVKGAVLGYLVLWCIYWVFKCLTGKEGMGYGDFKCLAALGAWLGWMQLPYVVLIASVTTLLFALLRMACGRYDLSHPIPFGPGLVLAGGALLLGGLVF